MDGEELEHLSDRDREILGMNVEPDAPEPPKTMANRVGDFIGYFVLFSVLAALAAIIAMFLVKGVILVYGWLF